MRRLLHRAVRVWTIRAHRGPILKPMRPLAVQSRSYIRSSGRKKRKKRKREENEIPRPTRVTFASPQPEASKEEQSPAERGSMFKPRKKGESFIPWLRRQLGITPIDAPSWLPSEDDSSLRRLMENILGDTGPIQPDSPTRIASRDDAARFRKHADEERKSATWDSVLFFLAGISIMSAINLGAFYFIYIGDKDKTAEALAFDRIVYEKDRGIPPTMWSGNDWDTRHIALHSFIFRMQRSNLSYVDQRLLESTPGWTW